MAEVAVGMSLVVSLVTPLPLAIPLLAAATLLSGFLAVQAVMLLRGTAADARCGCFGRGSAIGRATLARTAALLLAAIVALVIVLPAHLALAQSPEPPPGAHPHGTRSGLSVVDEILTAMEDGHGLVDELQFVPTPCTTQGGLGGLDCPEGVEDGTSLPAVFVGGCEGTGYLEGDPTLQEFFGQIGSQYYLYGLSRHAPPRTSPGTPGARFELYVTRGAGPLEWRRLYVGDTGILGASACEPSATDAFAYETEVIIAPVGAEPGPPALGTGLAPATSPGPPIEAIAIAGAVVAIALSSAAMLVRRHRP